jgi:predicted RNase H-like nuclease (RuvC/YqgF family)
MLSLTDEEAGYSRGDAVGSVDKTELADGLNIGDALNIADHLSQGYLDWSPEAEWVLRAQHSRIEEQQSEIDAAVELIKKFQEERDSLKLKIDEMAGDIMTLENRIGTMTGYGHN